MNESFELRDITKGERAQARTEKHIARIHTNPNAVDWMKRMREKQQAMLEAQKKTTH